MAINLKELFGKKKKEQPIDLMATPTGQGSGGKRVNGLPSAIVVFFLLLAVGTVAYVTHVRSQNKISPGAVQSEVQKEGRSASQMANDVTSPWTSGLIPSAPDFPSNSGSAPSKDHDPRQQQDEAPSPTETFRAANTSLTIDPYAEDRLRIRERRIQALEAALKSNTGVQLSELRNRSTTRDIGTQLTETRQRLASMTDPTSAYQARLAQLKGESLSGADDLYQPTATGKNDVRHFAQADSWQLDSQVETPASPYMLRAGFVIPAIMISGINSDLPGQVIAQVSQNVWDTATGKYLLIPQGTRLIGAYSSDVGYGQERVLMAWQRLIYPDGKTLDIRAMPGTDSAGYAGFKDKVNNHWFRTISSAILMSGVIAAVDLSQNDSSSNSDSDRQRANDALSEALGQTLGQTLGQIISKNLNISPTLEIRPGYRFNVMVIKDLTLPGCYQPFNYRIPNI